MSKIINIEGRGVSVLGNDIDTDRIIPARFLKEITFEKMGDYLFVDERFDQEGKEKGHPLTNPIYKGATIMVVGQNFGCGSSREHAPQAIKRFGFNAIIGESFAEIFAGNCKAIGVPTIRVSASQREEISTIIESSPTETISIDIQTSLITIAKKTWKATIPTAHQESFLQGTWNVIHLLRENSPLTKKVSQQLPY